MSSIDELHLVTFSILSNMKGRCNKFQHCHRSLTFLRRSSTKCTTKPVGKMLSKFAVVFESTTFKTAFCSLSSFLRSPISAICRSKLKNTLYPFLGVSLEDRQLCGQKMCMRYGMSVIIIDIWQLLLPEPILLTM